jgi:hypothetical protein
MRRATIRLAPTEPVPKRTSSPEEPRRRVERRHILARGRETRVAASLEIAHDEMPIALGVHDEAARLPSGALTGALPTLTGVPGTGDTSPA